MDSTHHPDPLPSPPPNGHPRLTKAIETGSLIILAVAICLITALGLVAIGIFLVLVFGMNNYGSNK
jgi:hypothetical protein